MSGGGIMMGLINSGEYCGVPINDGEGKRRDVYSGSGSVKR